MLEKWKDGVRGEWLARAKEAKLMQLGNAKGEEEEEEKWKEGGRGELLARAKEAED